MERAGWLVGEWEAIDKHAEGRPRRRYYTITERGQTELAAMLQRRKVS
jgi:DNA-binding PadR family transcriptional regulator